MSDDLSSDVEQFLAALRRALAAPPSPLEKELARSLRGVIHGYPELEAEARALGARGWTLPMWAHTGFVAEIASSVKAGETDAYFMDLYSADGGSRETELLESLATRPELAHWEPLLNECIIAYKQRLYRVTLPSLLLVLDGLIAAAGNRLNERSNAKTVASSLLQASMRPYVDWLAWLTIEAFVSRVFQSREFGGQRPESINRHWIMHGRDIPDWGQTDCLRLFQAIDTIGSVSSWSSSVRRAT